LQRSSVAAIERRRSSQRQLEVTLRAHDPGRTLERGYALAETALGEPLTSAAAALEAGELGLRFADGRVWAQIRTDELDAGT
jgi:exodeoxyribonuclease VII large subunit